MEYEFLDLENFKEELSNLIEELAEPYEEEFEHKKTVILQDPNNLYGFLGIEMFNYSRSRENKDSIFIERVYFPIALN